MAREVVVTCDFCGAPKTEEVEIRMSGRRIIADICADDRRARTLDEVLERGRVASLVTVKRAPSTRTLDGMIRTAN